MQRLYSFFPQGRPGIGLILLRLVVGAGLVLQNPIANLNGLSVAGYFAMGTVLMALAAGFLTPCIAAVCCLTAIVELAHRELGGVLPPLIFGVAAGALMLLGPGAYSIDAVFYGRRVLKLPD